MTEAATTSNPYSTPLALTTPHMRGQKVKDAQWLLAGHNDWHDKPSPIHTYYGRIDGEYGPATAGASKRAKYWLGYPAAQLSSTFGELLFNLLTGESKLSPEFLANRQARLKKAENPVKLKALHLAEAEVGTKESPFGSNCQKYGQWYGMNCCPWCAIFVSWCISHSGHEWKYSYVPNIHADAIRGRNGMSVTYHPEPGDLVCYTFAGQIDCHTAFFHSWVNQGAGTFYDVGGNTGSINYSNGGEVMKSTRYTSNVSAFVRLTL